MIKVYFCEHNDNTNSHELLFHAVLLHTGRADFPLRYERTKKPYFDSADAPKFSISHSGNYWICAMSDEEVGCDLQLHKQYPRYLTVAKRYFHENEIQKLTLRDDPCTVFFDIWSKKEAISKLSGEGINRNIKKIDSGNNEAFTKRLILPIESPYSAAIASYSKISDYDIEIVKI